jgi:phosphoadenosine phosphosulfate reductase
MSSPIDQLDLSALNDTFERQSPEQIIQWSFAQFGDDLIMSSSFGADSAVLLHMATQIAPKIRILFVDTGFIFSETFDFLEQLSRRMELNVHKFRTKNDPQEYLRRAGETDPAWRNNIDACCAANKNEPFDRGMRELKPRGWMRGIRRAQSATRKNRQHIEWFDRYNVFAISPLLKMSDRDIWQYLNRNGLPYHPLREQGYESIGCNPLSCTRPVNGDADPRSGRWAGTGKVECGINLNNSLDSAGL